MGTLEEPGALDPPRGWVGGVESVEFVVAQERVVVAGNDGARRNEGSLEVVEEVAWVLDTDTQADEVLGEAALGAEGWGDGCVAKVLVCSFPHQSAPLTT